MLGWITAEIQWMRNRFHMYYAFLINFFKIIFLAFLGLYYWQDSLDLKAEREEGEWYTAKGCRSEANPRPLHPGLSLYMWARAVPGELPRRPMYYSFKEKCNIYSFSQSLWYVSQIKIEILKTTCSFFTSLCNFFFSFFSLCYAVLSFPFCIAMTWSVNKLQYKQ